MITRSRFEELIQYKLVQTLELTQQMMNMYAGKRKIDAGGTVRRSQSYAGGEANAGEKLQMEFR